MTSKEYFNYLASVLSESAEAIKVNQLNEASATAATPAEVDSGAQAQEDPAMAADTGLEGQEVPAEEEVAEEDPSMDTSYMDPAEPVEPTIDDITQQQQKEKLFDNFNELINLAEYARDSFKEKTSLDLLNKDQYEILIFGIEKFDGIIKKIKDYQLNSFLLREYKESLYVYMLLRSELLTVISYIRKALKLHNLTNVQDEKKK